MAGPTVEGFSVTHAAILDGATNAYTVAPTVGDIYGVRSGSLDVDTDSYDNTGDDSILSTWSWFNFATLSIQSGYIPFELIQTLTGASITSSGTAPADFYSIPLWNESSLNQPVRPVLVRVPSKDQAGTPRVLDFVLFRVQFEPITFDGPNYKDGLLLNYSGKCLMSDKDETGTTLGTGKRAIGRIISRPTAGT